MRINKLDTALTQMLEWTDKNILKSYYNDSQYFLKVQKKQGSYKKRYKLKV